MEKQTISPTHNPRSKMLHEGNPRRGLHPGCTGTTRFCRTSGAHLPSRLTEYVPHILSPSSSHTLNLSSISVSPTKSVFLTLGPQSAPPRRRRPLPLPRSASCVAAPAPAPPLRSAG
jgi:hypothetical protein